MSITNLTKLQVTYTLVKARPFENLDVYDCFVFPGEYGMTTSSGDAFIVPIDIFMKLSESEAVNQNTQRICPMKPVQIVAPAQPGYAKVLGE